MAAVDRGAVGERQVIKRIQQQGQQAEQGATQPGRFREAEAHTLGRVALLREKEQQVRRQTAAMRVTELPAVLPVRLV